jgi:hypothetical protein
MSDTGQSASATLTVLGQIAGLAADVLATDLALDALATDALGDELQVDPGPSLTFEGLSATIEV